MRFAESEETIVKLLKETAELVDQAIKRYSCIKDLKLQKKIDYALKPKGNRERPLLVKLSCEAMGGNFKDIIPAAVAVELFHFSTLVLDDVLDDSPLRMGFKTVCAKYGNKYATLVAEILNSLALKSLLDISRIKNPFLATEVIKRFISTYHNLYHGQYLDLSFEHREYTTKEQYLDMISKTTGSLIKCSLEIGAILGGGTKAEIKCLSKYGDTVGKAFQIRDDIAEIIGDPNIIGKKLGGDIKQGKMRLPMIKALSVCKNNDKKYLINIIKNKNNEENKVKKCIKILIECGAVEYSKKVAFDFSRKAIKYLKPIKSSPAKDGLIAFADVVGSLR